MNKNKIILIAVAAATITVMLATALVINIMDRESEEPDQPEVSEETPAFTPAQTQWGELPVPPSILGSSDGTVLPEVVAMEIADEARALVREFLFEDAEAYILERILPYDIEDSPAYNELLWPIRIDLPAMSQFDYLVDYSMEDRAIELTRNLSDPVNLVIGTLWHEPSSREWIIMSSDSLNPTYGVIDSIGPAKKVSRTVPGYEEVSAVYEVPMTLDGYELVATITDDYGWLHLYSIDEREGVESPFITISEWHVIRDDFYGIEEPDTEEQTEEIMEGEEQTDGEDN